MNTTNRNKYPEKFPNTTVISPNDGIAQLIILGNTHYNGTQVQCKAGYQQSTTAVESGTATLYVQGERIRNILQKCCMFILYSARSSKDIRCLV